VIHPTSRFFAGSLSARRLSSLSAHLPGCLLSLVVPRLPGHQSPLPLDAPCKTVFIFALLLSAIISPFLAAQAFLMSWALQEALPLTGFLSTLSATRLLQA
jgi:hypothetical protein